MLIFIEWSFCCFCSWSSIQEGCCWFASLFPAYLVGFDCLSLKILLFPDSVAGIPAKDLQKKLESINPKMIDKNKLKDIKSEIGHRSKAFVSDSAT